jgi:hypothetical protein
MERPGHAVILARRGIHLARQALRGRPAISSARRLLCYLIDPLAHHELVMLTQLSKKPVVIPLPRFPTFEVYLSSLSPKRRYDCRLTMRLYPIPYRLVDFDPDEVSRFMALWARQKIYGNPIKWQFDVEQVEEWNQKGELMVFKGGDIALQFIQKRKRENAWHAHAPLYDKEVHSGLAKFMWFNLIKYMIENRLGDLDLGFVSSAEKRTEYKYGYVPRS